MEKREEISAALNSCGAPSAATKIEGAKGESHEMIDVLTRPPPRQREAELEKRNGNVDAIDKK